MSHSSTNIEEKLSFTFDSLASDEFHVNEHLVSTSNRVNALEQEIADCATTPMEDEEQQEDLNEHDLQLLQDAHATTKSMTVG